MKSNNLKNLKLIFFISFMVIGIFSDDAPISLNSDGTCPSGREIAKVGSSPDSLTNKCVLKTKLIYDCHYYSDDDANTCTCDSSKNAAQLNIYLSSTKACIPEIEQVVNCKYYTRQGPHNYNCYRCPTEAPFLVTISTESEDSNSIPKACSKHIFPNCQVYKVYTTTFQIGSDTTGGFVIGCKTCSNGFTAFSTDNTDSLTYLGATDNGVACPKDGTYECTAMIFEENQYKCDCGVQQLVKFKTVSGTQQIEQGCLATTAALYDANCDKYIYNSNADLVACDTCKANYYLLSNVVGPADGNLFSFCFNYEIEGCTTYATTGTDMDVAAALADVWCKTCDSDYTLLQSTTATINELTDTVIGYCALTTRWIIDDDVCLNYQKPNFKTDLYLVCIDCQDNAGDNAPCYTTGSQKAGSCTGGQLSALKFGDPNNQICITQGIIDNCQLYTDFDPNTNIATGCSQCKSGHLLVNTTATGTTKICIPNSAQVVNCSVYNNKDLTCAFCTSGLSYDNVNSRCKNANQIGTPCLKALQVGSVSFCVVCLTGYTLLNNKCVPAVSMCSQFNVNGFCTSCISGYRLINNNCIKIPPNCNLFNQNGECTSCKPGFEINSNKECLVSTKNTCYPGLVPFNGQCIPVQQPIKGCVSYTLDSKCDQCIEGYIPTKEKKECVRITSPENPNLKPCPPSTNRVIYKRNPSNPFGDCVAVDVNCANPRDDGHCIECKPGEFAHIDGLCYKIVYSN